MGTWQLRLSMKKPRLLATFSPGGTSSWRVLARASQMEVATKWKFPVRVSWGSILLLIGINDLFGAVIFLRPGLKPGTLSTGFVYCAWQPASRILCFQLPALQYVFLKFRCPYHPTFCPVWLFLAQVQNSWSSAAKTGVSCSTVLREERCSGTVEKTTGVKVPLFVYFPN